jgi:hypothetical protein
MTREQGQPLHQVVWWLRAQEIARQYQNSPTQFETLGTAYSGVLAQPMSVPIGYLCKRRKPYWYTGNDEAWAAQAAAIINREEDELEARISALARFYGISLSPEPDWSDGWPALALALAEAHVPGFAAGRAYNLVAKLPGKGAPPVLTTEQTLLLARCVYDALITGVSEDSAIASLARRNADIIVPSRGRGPRKRGTRGGKPLSRQTARHLVEQMRGAWEGVVNRRATAFQFGVVVLALTSRPGHGFPDWGVIFGLRVPNITPD